jgi:phosphotransferase system  glucose/maltose/N-acetylglucosamine-specific IIC component
MAADASVTGVGSAIDLGVTNAKDVIGNNMPTVFGVAIAFVAWHVGRRVLGKI